MLYAIFIDPDAGLPYDVVDAKEAGLIVGNKYEVEDISMGGSYTYIYLEGVEGCFNSVQFDFEEDGKPIDIYGSTKYNPYI